MTDADPKPAPTSKPTLPKGPPFPTWSFTSGDRFFHAAEAWTGAEIRTRVQQILAHVGDRLPEDRQARIVVKPNLNNDLVALTGNSVDLRVLAALLTGLVDLGYTHVTVADGSNVGIERRDIDTFARLRVDRLCRRFGVHMVDLNRDPGARLPLHDEAEPRIGRTVQESDYLISVPKVKTHAEAALSCAMKNWVGIAVGQDKRHLHYDLNRNIHAINQAIRPDLVVVDGVVGMEGNGPGDGDPFRLGLLAVASDAFLNDLCICRLVAHPWQQVPALVYASQEGDVDENLAHAVERALPALRPIVRPPPRSRLAILSEAPQLAWLKRMVRPFVERPKVAETAYRLGIIQDVYSRADDTLRVTGRWSERCQRCTRCEEVCPLGLDPGGLDPGATADGTEPEDCIQCLYCWFVCPEDAIRVEGEQNHLTRQVARYRDTISALFAGGPSER